MAATSLEKAAPIPEPPPRTNDSTALTGGESRGTLPVDAAISATASATRARKEVIFFGFEVSSAFLPDLDVFEFRAAGGKLPASFRDPFALERRERTNARERGG